MIINGRVPSPEFGVDLVRYFSNSTYIYKILPVESEKAEYCCEFFWIIYCSN